MVTPIAEPEQLAAWREIVARDVAAWNVALSRAGCSEPFAVGADGHSARLVPVASWERPGSIGVAREDWIEVLADASGAPREDARMLHELGHALGLEHADGARGDSLMTPSVGSWLFARDVEAAACRLGCGSCEAGADPYDLP